MPIKVTLFMSAENYSWSEAHYLLTASQFALAQPTAIQLANLRAALLGEYATMTTVRMSMVPANRIVQDVPSSMFNKGNGNGFTAALIGQTSSDQPYSALLCRLGSAVGSKNLYISGIPDDVIIVDPAYPSGYDPGWEGFGTLLNNYLAFLTSPAGASAWGYRSRSTANETHVSQLVDAVGYGNNIGVLTFQDPGLNVGDEAYLSGFRRINPRSPTLAGAYKVLAKIPPGSGTPLWTIVLNETGNVDTTNFLSLGNIAPLTWNYVAYTSAFPIKATHRKRGGSYNLPRGRSRVRS